MKLKRFLSLPVLSVFLLLGFIYYVTIFIFIEDLSGLRSSAGLVNSLIFSLLAFLCVFSFIACVLTDPGEVPSGYTPDVEENQSPDQEIKKNGTPARTCDKCSAHKPPRAHHCRVCGRCVLRMDHHCTWINNCVGLRNYKSFLLLVFYATLASTYSAIVIVSCTLQKDWGSFGNLRAKNIHVGCGLLSISLCLTLGSLFIWHVYLTSRNMTTIEGNRAGWLARRSVLSYNHRYDVGAYKNFTLVLGPDTLKWLWPTANSHIKDGLGFPTSS
ncbi:putative DHHC-type Zn-finger protein [Handroanthus impetiginosus]|uniref:S-acyltransferase n=1 Tax=Handroanthus impetiginosus TaxID=429701 RepID=A0A2G9G3N3_9LAMI|nr:putative DHHC-type Zn-finger protein [Handroanthus impetiginosus]